MFRFGRDLWGTCVKIFHEDKRGTPTTQSQPKKVTELAEKLMDYYQQIVESN